MTKENVKTVGVLGSAHAVVDTATISALFATLIAHGFADAAAASWVLGYAILAFGLQPMFGRISDAAESPREMAVFGCILVGISLFTVGWSPEVTIIITGLGNAMFHVGGGAISLNLTPGRATAPGLFVAPGAIGLMLGTMIGRGGHFVVWPIFAALCISVAAMLFMKVPSIDYKRRHSGLETMDFAMAALLLFGVVAVRAFIGLGIVLPWKSEIGLVVALTITAVTGKALGGIIADRYGWSRVAVTALIAAAPLLAFGRTLPGPALLGAGLFNMTMAVTLTAVAGLFPGRPGFAFGLPCLALMLGSLPVLSTAQVRLTDPWFILVVIGASAAALYVGLRLALGTSELPGVGQTVWPKPTSALE